jgi:hypothetical protein
MVGCGEQREFLSEDILLWVWDGLEGPVVQFEEGIFDIAADGVEGEVVWGEAEWVFEFIGDGFEGDVGVGDESHEDGHKPAEAIDEAEGEEEAIEVYGTVEEDAIGIGDGCAGDAFAAADDIGKLIEVLVEGLLRDGIYGAAVFGGLDGLAEFFYQQDRFIAGGLYADGQGGGEEAVDVGCRLGSAELVFEGIGEGDEVIDE